MPLWSKSIPYNPGRILEFDWDTFAKGLNTILRDNEIKKDELAQAENLMLIGRGVPTKRWGTALFYQAGNATGSVRGLKGFYKSDGTNELLAVTDDGYLTKRNGSSFTQLNDTMYIVNGHRALARYSSPTLVGFATIAPPTILSATNLSNASGTTQKSYRVSAISEVGETLASTPFVLNNQPSSLGDPAGGTIRLTFTSASNASLLRGFNIYGRDSGNERFIATVDASSTRYDDDGSAIAREFTYTPTSDSTGGPIAKYITRHQDRLAFAGLAGEGAKVLISGKAPFNERFDLGFGGNFIQIEKDAGDDITQLWSFKDRIVVFKQRSIWQITLGTSQIGNFFVTEPAAQLITASYGCIAPNSVVAVENDIFFLSREGVNTLGYQANYAIDALRTNAISTKVRPFFDALTTAQKQSAVAKYFKKKYVITFPGLNKTMIYDIERGAWMGPWTTDGRVFEVYTDASNNEHLLFGDDTTTNVYEYSDMFTTDSGAAIQTILKTRREDFGDWSSFKNLKHLFFQFRNVQGSANIDIRIEKRSGSERTADNFSITPQLGSSGWGADLWGSATWGGSNGRGGGSDSQQLIRWRQLQIIGRTIQMTIKTSGANDTYELLGIRGQAKRVSEAFRPTSWKS
jgi:hypothetical protein